MTMYENFKTSETLETQGVVIDYGDFRVTLARAGGANKRFGKVFEAKTKPYRRAIQTETMDEGVAMRILSETYAETAIKLWEVKDADGNWKEGIEAPDGSTLPFDVRSILSTFENIPDLFADIREQAGMAALYREMVLEEDSKN